MQMSKNTFQRIITLCFKMLFKTPCLAFKSTHYPCNQFCQELDMVLQGLTFLYRLNCHPEIC